ncbi:hypothetical protein M0R45_012963 [Rubus argutus]|uniref:Uncharacterized protein n=1 Tax=Rubus argutus TaxID=59490 RepID=A0AAW1XHC2_RUBAR
MCIGLQIEGSRCPSFIEAIEYHDLGRNAKVLFSRTATVEAIVNVELSREVLIHLDIKDDFGLLLFYLAGHGKSPKSVPNLY